MHTHNIVEAIVLQGMLPLFYHDSAATTVEIVETLYQAGIRVFEYTNRGTAAFANFQQLKAARDKKMPDLLLGIGTVKSIEEAEMFAGAGADFIVAPIISPEVGEFCNENGLLWIPGCMTPTEIQLARKYQAQLIKIFPANILGPAFISSIRELFPGQRFLPTGGVAIEESNLRAWFQAGVCAVGMGSQLISKDILQNRDYGELSRRASLATTLIAQCRD